MAGDRRSGSSTHGAVGAAIPMGQVAQHGGGDLLVTGMHGVDVGLVVADQCRPSVVAAIEPVEEEDARQGIEPAEVGIGPEKGLLRRIDGVPFSRRGWG